MVKIRVAKKFQGWESSHLSLVGREILIKAVARAILANCMAVLKFLRVLIARF